MVGTSPPQGRVHTPAAERHQDMHQNDVCTNICQNHAPTQQGTNLLFSGNSGGRSNHPGDLHCSTSTLSLPGPPHYKALLPAILPGTRCYIHAAIAPNTPLQVSRKSGLGIFIVNNHPEAASTVYIKTVKKDCNSVIMAEAAALALGAQILRALRVHQPFFLSDNQQLVSFFNGTDHANPPHWDIKPLTQTFINIISLSLQKEEKSSK